MLLLAVLLGCVVVEAPYGVDYIVETPSCGDPINVDGAAVLEVYACCEPDAACSPTTYTIAGTLLTAECGDGCYASVTLLDVEG